MSQWEHIWNKENRVHYLILDTLIKADGFDVSAGNFQVKDWLNYVDTILHKHLNIEEQDSIFDVGCGAGAFLYPLYTKGHTVGGIDYAKVLIDLAKKIIDSKSFKIQKAIQLDTSKKYDIVVSHSVFHYFDSLTYAEKVIERMLKKATKKVAILDINDSDKQEVYHKVRAASMDKKTYAKQYKGLEHLFYEKKWFKQIAHKHHLSISIKNQKVKNYANAPLRFNVIIEK